MRAKDLLTLLNSLIEIHGEDIPVFIGLADMEGFSFQYLPIEKSDIVFKEANNTYKPMPDRIEIG